MKILELNGYKYSTQPFDGHKFRAKFVVFDKEHNHIVNTDIYTDNQDKNEVCKIFMGKVLSKLNSNTLLLEESGIINWTTKEQDELTAKFIEETLKDI